MPSGYATTCKVCNHPRRAEIEGWHREGASFREISRRLGGEVSHLGVRNHIQEHFNVPQEAERQYQESQAQLQAAGAAVVSDVQRLDAVIAQASDLHRAAGAWLADLLREKGRLPKALVDAYAVTASELRQQIKTKTELLGRDAESRKADAMQEQASALTEVERDALRAAEDAYLARLQQP